jgi:DnaJ homolog subfamily C member 28
MPSIEEHIQKAIEEGKFDNLPGKGKPLHLEENPHEDPEWRLANHLLHTAGFNPPWIENLREIENEAEAARAGLSRAWNWRKLALAGNQSPVYVEAEWAKAQGSFREKIITLNKRIFDYNLQTPSDRFQIPALNIDRELERLTTSPLSDTL